MLTHYKYVRFEAKETDYSSVQLHCIGFTSLNHKKRFTFTGKERDEETGYSYFGARYYDSGLPNIVLAVDPMSDKYPNISPYAYCAWNPVKLVDPDGEWPWEPKHIRNARKFARQNDGYLNISTQVNGVKLATVAYNKNTEYGKTASIASFAPAGYSSRGEIRETSGIANVEMWMNSPFEGIGDAMAKIAANIAYGIPNDVSMLLTGKTLGRSDVNPADREEAFAGAASTFLAPFLKTSGVITNTKVRKGLQGYNEYVEKNPGIIKQLTRKGAGNAVKRNQILQENILDFDRTQNSIQTIKEMRNGLDE